MPWEVTHMNELRMAFASQVASNMQSFRSLSARS